MGHHHVSPDRLCGKTLDMDTPPYFIAAFYRFASLPEYVDMQAPLKSLCADNGVMGTLLLASEGVNGTIAGPQPGVMKVLDWLASELKAGALSFKSAWSRDAPFRQMKVRLKKEIVTMGIDGVDPNKHVGQYVDPNAWNTLIRDPAVTLIDTRNTYESDLGTFEGAQLPLTDSFTEFPEWAERNLTDKEAKIAMFCTGGIRCEKATSLLVEAGYTQVFHLEGGILKYLEETPEHESLWRGECFVFDGRVTVDHNLDPGSYILCPACGRGVSQADVLSPLYQKGVSCPACFHETSPSQKARFAERQRQIDLAAARGEEHVKGRIMPKRRRGEDG